MTPTELLQSLSALLSGQRVDIIGAFRDDAVATDASSSLSPAEVVDHLSALAPASPTILHTVHDESSLTILLETVDEVTGLNVRESWSFVLERGLVGKVFACSRGMHIQTRWPPADREVEPYLAGFGLRYPEPADEPLVRRAAQAVAEQLNREVTFDHHDVLINDELVYVPHGWIGCVGFLVPRDSWTPILLGSGIPVRVHIWAYYRGFADGETGDERLNDLVITAVKDREATRRALRQRLLIIPDLGQLPVRIRGIDLYFLRETLWEAELRGHFRFHVEPSSRTV